MIKKLVTIILVFLMSISMVAAVNTFTLQHSNAAGNAIGNIHSVAVQCNDGVDCSAISSALDEHAAQPSISTATLEVPATTENTFFAGYTFHDSYLPHVELYQFNGDGVTLSPTPVTLNKKGFCTATVDSFTVTNAVEPYYPIQIDVEASLAANTYSAFSFVDTTIAGYEAVNDPNNPYFQYWSAETQVWVEVVDPNGVTVFSPAPETFDIFADDSIATSWSWTPTDTTGEYTATVHAMVTDPACQVAAIQQEEANFQVIETAEDDFCYTLIQSLALDEPYPVMGQTYNIAFQKISNEAEDGVLTPLQTDITVDILTPSGVSQTGYPTLDTLPANANPEVYEIFTYPWTPTTSGNHIVSVEGNAAAYCQFSEDLDSSMAQTIYVASAPGNANQAPVAIHGGPYFAEVGENIIFWGENSFDPDGDDTLLTFDWAFGDDDATVSTEANPTFAYDEAGTFSVALTVTDGEGASTTVLTTAIITEPVNALPTAEITAPATADEGDSVSMSGVNSNDPDGSIVSYAWDFEDDGVIDATGVSAATTYATAGTYNIRLTVTDNAGATDDDVHTIVINPVIANVPPTADITAPASADEGVAVTMSGVNSVDTDGTITLYEWDFEDDGVIDATGVSAATTYATAGTYDIRLTVTDDDGATDDAVHTITINPVIGPNNAPVAVIVAPSTATTSVPVTLDGTASTDVEDDAAGIPLTYVWDLNTAVNSDGLGTALDDIDATGDTVAIVFPSAGTFEVALTVTDSNGASSQVFHTIVVSTAANVPPVANAGGPYAGFTFQAVSLDGSASTDVDGTIVLYEWDFETDGVIDASSTSPTATAYYSAAATYTLTLTVTDDAGAVNSQATTVEVTDDPSYIDIIANAIASASPTSGEPDLLVQFSSDGTVGNVPLAYLWNFGDGDTSTEANPSHWYTDEGVFTATLTVTDADGDVSTTSITIYVDSDFEIENIASRHTFVNSIRFVNDEFVKAGEYVVLYMHAENIAGFDKEGEQLKASIPELGIYVTSEPFEFGQGDREDAVVVLPIPADTLPGMYTVRITISDDFVQRFIHRDLIVY